MFDLNALLREAIAKGASDIHISPGQPPAMRLHGDMVRRGNEPLATEAVVELCRQILPNERRQEFDEHGEVDYAYMVEGVGRFRVNVYKQRGTPAVALRIIPGRVKTLAELGLPDILAAFCEKPHGLVVVTGPTGSGKSSTLAAMINQINDGSSKHIITLEDPIEFVHTNKRSIINQREIGADTNSFARGLRSALRQDPDVILLGEMRDLDTIEIALQAAETGHLVFATLHTNDAPSTIDRIIDVFPPGQQQQVKTQLGAALQGVIAQRLYRRSDRKGRLACLEILTVTSAVRNLIREGKTHQILSVIQTGGKQGMRTMESSVKESYERGMLAKEDYQSFILEQGGGLSTTNQGTAGFGRI